ncbi:Uncharacterised protein [Legionella wadsworthii]|uniref:Uncharacterized protein n=1 Tax=Legionella wadsworthii TaxID=28088 RepID=A0A378LS69_9GAMM|nr:hypothetical protein [Legionella wadsworthii]STY29537.1 Uncharacterised protein [Legionella wadsworthii]
MPKIQPGGQIGPNNAGKMILRGCFMNVSQAWMEEKSGPIGAILLDYLNNRCNEATPIKLNYGEAIPPHREKGPFLIDIEFTENVVAKLKNLELKGNELAQASPDEIYDQVTDQVMRINQEILKYKFQCDREGISPMFVGIPDVIIENVKSRDPVTHAESLNWENIYESEEKEENLDLFEGMTLRESSYEPPDLSSLSKK